MLVAPASGGGDAEDSAAVDAAAVGAATTASGGRAFFHSANASCTLQRLLDSQVEPATVVPVLVEPASGGGDAEDAAAVDAAAVDAATTASDNAGCGSCSSQPAAAGIFEPASSGGDDAFQVLEEF